MACGQRKACRRCRTLKMKCDRVFPSCGRCIRTGHSCEYLRDTTFRIRDQTDSAANRAIRQWRARSKDIDVQHMSDYTPSPPPCITLPVTDLARQRFLHDFTESGRSPFFAHLHRSVEPHGLDPGNVEETGLAMAFSAVSLANFHRRYFDQRADDLAHVNHGKALTKLGGALSHLSDRGSYELVFMAVLLGIYQNIYQEFHLAGAWIQHLCGAINLLSQCPNGTAEYRHLSHMLLKFASVLTLRTGIVISLPPSLKGCLDSENELEMRILRLSFETTVFCSTLRGSRQDVKSAAHIMFDNIHILEKAFNGLHQDLSRDAPYRSIKAGPKSFPTWYSPISKHPGAPSDVHIYTNETSHLWNLYRMARLKFQYALLKFDPELAPLPLRSWPSHCPSGDLLNKLQEADAIEYSTFICLVDEICSSIFYVLTGGRNGKSPLTSFDGVSGSRALALISPLNQAMDGLNFCEQDIAERVLPGRISWIQNVLEVLGEKAGIREAWCFTDEDEAEARARISEQLRFDT